MQINNRVKAFNLEANESINQLIQYTNELIRQKAHQLHELMPVCIDLFQMMYPLNHNHVFELSEQLIARLTGVLVRLTC